MLMGVAKMGLRWELMSSTLRTTMWDQFLLTIQNSPEHIVGSAFWAAGTLGYPLRSQPMQQVVLERGILTLKKCNSWGLCNVLFGLAKMDMRWSNLPPTLTDALISNVLRLESDMNAFDLGTLLWSIGEIDFPLDCAPRFFVEKLMAAVESRVPQVCVIKYI
jgi:hypothetical protein